MRRKRELARNAAAGNGSVPAATEAKRRLDHFHSGGVVRYWRMRTCTGKVRHDSYEAAQAESIRLAQHVQLTAEFELNAYYCPFCDGFHVGSRQRDSASFRLVKAAV